MSYSSVDTANKVSQWSKKFFWEYTRDYQFASETGRDANKVFQAIRDLEKDEGEAITVPLIAKLRSPGVLGDATLRGNEEPLLDYGHKIEIDWIRNAVAMTKKVRRQSVIDKMEEVRPALKLWSMENLRDNNIRAMMSPNINGTTAYALCSEDEKDEWVANNSDRILFGSERANLVGGDHSASLRNIGTTNDKLTLNNLSLIRRMMRMSTDRAVRPVSAGASGEMYVAYVPSLAWRDLKANTTYSTILKDAGVRGRDNPLFKDGDLYWDGMILREIPEIPTIPGVGNGDSDVAPVFICGAQAVGIAWGQTAQIKSDTFDYDFVKGLAIEELRGTEKLFFDKKQHGMGTLYVSVSGDA